jgi:hypothetical protein
MPTKAVAEYLAINNSSKDIVVHLLKTRTAEPEKQPLLVNGSETTFTARQENLNKQVNAAVTG